VFESEIFGIRHQLKENKERISTAYGEMRSCFWFGLLFTIGGMAYGFIRQLDISRRFCPSNVCYFCAKIRAAGYQVGGTGTFVFQL
jgi:hypothetical protein